MLQAAIYQPRRGWFEQRAISDNGVVLLHSGGSWRAADPPADGLQGPWVEFRHTGGRIAVRRSPDTRFEVQLHKDGAEQKLYVGQKTPAPALLAFADLLVDIGTPAGRVSVLRDADDRNAGDENTADDRRLDAGRSARARAIASLGNWSTGATELFQNAARIIVRSLGFDRAYLVQEDDSSETDGWRVVAADFEDPSAGIRLDMSRLHALRQSSGLDSQVWIAEPWQDPVRRKTGLLVAVGSAASKAAELRALAHAISDELAARSQSRSRVLRRSTLRLACGERPQAVRDQSVVLLDGDQRDVSVLRIDLSRLRTQIGERLENALSLPSRQRLLLDVRETLIRTIEDYEGTLLDHHDPTGVAASWNASCDQREHARLACVAALRCHAAWNRVAAEHLALNEPQWRLNVAVSTGRVGVGNAGGRLRVEHGVCGEAMRMARSVAQASHGIPGSPIITRETADRLDGSGDTTINKVRLGRAPVAGVSRTLELFLIYDDRLPSGLGADNEAYQSALACYEAGRLDASARVLRDAPHDSPAGWLAARVARAKEERRRRQAPALARTTRTAS